MKIAFVGIKSLRERHFLNEISRKKGTAVEFFNDFEKAKQWVLP